MKPTTWIDLTDLVDWVGPHTGIQRVVYNLARYFDSDGQARFFAYDEKSRQFDEIELDMVQPRPVVPRPPSRRNQLKCKAVFAAKTNYNRLPLTWRQELSPILKPLAVQTYNRAHHTVHIARTIVTRPPKAAVARRPVTFCHGDTVVILGAGWHYPTILDELWRRKQNAGFRVVHFIHDMIPTLFPHLFGPGHFELSTGYAFDMASVCDLFITNSESSMRDTEAFCRELNLPLVPIKVIRIGDELELASEPRPLSVPLDPGFVLTAGTIENRKNHALLYFAYKQAILRGIKLPKLVIVGRPGWNAGDIVYAMMNDPEVKDHILLTRNVDDSQLLWLYQNCRFTVYPSMYEGWGMPVAESLVLGKLCLTTNVSSMPEIAGSLIDYFSPFDSGECLQVMQKYLDDETLAAKEAEIRAHYKVQTWEAAYHEFIKAL